VLHSFPCTRAEFGAPLPLVVPGLLLPVRVPRQPFGCEFPGEGALAGAVAVVRRGVCSFQAKASTMEQAGAAAVVVVNTPGSNVFRMPPGGAFGRPEVNVPAVMTSHRDGEVVMKAALEHEDAQVGADSVQQEQLLLRMHEVAVRACVRVRVRRRQLLMHSHAASCCKHNGWATVLDLTASCAVLLHGVVIGSCSCCPSFWLATGRGCHRGRGGTTLAQNQVPAT